MKIYNKISGISVFQKYSIWLDQVGGAYIANVPLHFLAGRNDLKLSIRLISFRLFLSLRKRSEMLAKRRKQVYGRIKRSDKKL